MTWGQAMWRANDLARRGGLRWKVRGFRRVDGWRYAVFAANPGRYVVAGR